jgi:hypothetical protein
MTYTTIKTFQVAVIECTLAFYTVEAKDARTAAENWQDGDFSHSDDEIIDTEGPHGIRAKQPDGTWREVPESEWQPAEELSRFEDYEIEPRMKHWEDGDPQRPDHVLVDEPDADMWRLYGHTRGRDSICIGEYATRGLAEQVYAAITGRRYARPVRS